MIFIVAFSTVHAILFLWAAWYWSRISEAVSSNDTSIGFSVLIPVRNEESTIELLLQDISKQTYSKNLFEVIVLDDHSEDETGQRVEKFCGLSTLSVRYVALPPDLKGKKAALTSGVSLAKHPIILTVDGDCRVGPDWIAGYAAAYSAKTAKMIAGPVRMEGDSLFEKLQIVEFGALVGFGAAALQAQRPSMCNGANLSYRKDAFLEVKGYEGNAQIPSGDDEFLMQKIFAKYPDQVHFLKDDRAIVRTSAKPNLSEFINQRVRWSGKWRHHKNLFVHLLAIGVFLDYFSLIVGIGLALAGLFPLTLLIFLMGLRYLAEVALAWPVSRFLKVRSFLLPSLILQIIYPFCVSFLGFASIFGHYSWKGRKY